LKRFETRGGCGSLTDFEKKIIGSVEVETRMIVILGILVIDFDALLWLNSLLGVDGALFALDVSFLKNMLNHF